MYIPRARLLDLMKVQCRIFSSTFNPEGLRTGNRVLRQRLRGPALLAYYPRKMATIQDLQKAYPEATIINEEEEDRLSKIKILKSKGKGAPKKKRTAGESKKNAGKRG